MLIAKKLLTTLYELEDLDSHFKRNTEEFRNNPPRYLRYQQIEAMMKFLDFDIEPKDFHYLGMNEMLTGKNQELAIEMINNMEIPFDGVDNFKEIGDIAVTYWYLYNFRRKIHIATNTNFISEGVGNYSIGETIKEKLHLELKEKYAWIDRILFFIVDPKNTRIQSGIIG